MVEVKLVGMNVPLKILEEINGFPYASFDFKNQKPKTEDEMISMIMELSDKFTPEIFSAAAARISRSDKSVDELIEEAWEDVPKAQKSNKNIITGMGHHSVADHALFNYTIKGISRLAVESIEKRRLAGYTEKSQRYVTLEGDYIQPEEFSKEDLNKFNELVTVQNDFYFYAKDKIFEQLKKNYSSKMSMMDEKARRILLRNLEGKAKEDARYALCLATETQLACSFPGQTIEHAIRKLKHGRLKEDQDSAKQFFDETVKYASSLIPLADSGLYGEKNLGASLEDENFEKGDANLRRLVEQAFIDNKKMLQYSHYKKNRIIEDGDVKLVRCKSLDVSVLAALLFTNSKESAQDSYALGYLMAKKHLATGFVKEALKYLSKYDKAPREFEMGPGLAYEIHLSSSAFGQLKRHRMMTLLDQDYDVSLGFTTPETIKEAGCEENFREIVERSSELYKEFLPKYGKAAEYCLTNAHRKRVLVGINERELYHFSRTREDEHAQWDIKNITHSMSRLAKQAAPLTSILLGGKSEFESIKNTLYNPE